MSLSPGSVLGTHEIVGLLGAGGMGEVYRARDTRLNRQVAIKVLPEAYASDRGHPVWKSNDELLLNIGPGQSVRVPFVDRPRVSIGPPSEFSRVGRIEGPTGTTRRNIDAMPGGGQVLGVMPEATSINTDPRINVVLNWFTELNQRAARR